MPSVTLNFDNAREAQQLFDYNPKNLRMVKEAFGVEVTARDGIRDSRQSRTPGRHATASSSSSRAETCGASEEKCVGWRGAAERACKKKK